MTTHSSDPMAEVAQIPAASSSLGTGFIPNLRGVRDDTRIAFSKLCERLGELQSHEIAAEEARISIVMILIDLQTHAKPDEAGFAEIRAFLGEPPSQRFVYTSAALLGAIMRSERELCAHGLIRLKPWHMTAISAYTDHAVRSGLTHEAVRAELTQGNKSLGDWYRKSTKTSGKGRPSSQKEEQQADRVAAGGPDPGGDDQPRTSEVAVSVEPARGNTVAASSTSEGGDTVRREPTTATRAPQIEGGNETVRGQKTTANEPRSANADERREWPRAAMLRQTYVVEPPSELNNVREAEIVLYRGPNPRLAIYLLGNASLAMGVKGPDGLAEVLLDLAASLERRAEPVA